MPTSIHMIIHSFSKQLLCTVEAIWESISPTVREERDGRGQVKGSQSMPWKERWGSLAVLPRKKAPELHLRGRMEVSSVQPGDLSWIGFLTLPDSLRSQGNLAGREPRGSLP